MVRDTWHIVSGSKSSTCHVQNESNMSSNGTHERHVATCEWVKIYVRWIRDKVKSKSTNEGLTRGKRKENSLDLCLTNQFGRGESKTEKGERKEERF